VQTAVVEPLAAEPIEVLIVWSGILRGDDAAAAARSQAIVRGARVRHFWDAERQIGAALAHHLNVPPLVEVPGGDDAAALERVFAAGFVRGGPVAYDSALFFAPGATWGSPAPAPAGWVTQLDPAVYAGVDPARSFFGPALAQELGRLARELLARR
jgi:hypothetical protein